MTSSDRNARWGNARNSRAAFVAEATRQTDLLGYEAAHVWALLFPADAKALGMDREAWNVPTYEKAKSVAAVIPTDDWHESLSAAVACGGGNSFLLDDVVRKAQAIWGS